MTVTWILILWVGEFHTGMALTSVPGFASIEECARAGRAAEATFGHGTDEARFVCVHNDPRAAAKDGAK